MSLITASVPPSCTRSIGGVSELYLAPREFANTFNLDLSPPIRIEDQDSYIASVTYNGATVDWYQWYVDERTVALTENKGEGNQGTYYQQAISLLIPGLTAYKRSVLLQLKFTPVVAIIKDRTGTYWLAGQQFGLKVTAYQATTNNIGGGQEYTLTLEGVDQYPFRQVSSDFTASIVPEPIP